MKSVVIIGAGGSGRETIETFGAQNQISPNWNILGFIDDSPELHGSPNNDHDVQGKSRR